MRTPQFPTASAQSTRLAPTAPTLLVALGIHLIGFTASTSAAPGDLDPAFGTGGVAVASFGTVDAGTVNALAIQPDGKIVVAGSVNGWQTTKAIARFNPDGSLDASFADRGIALIGGSVVNAVAVQPDGKILVAGTTGQSFSIERLNPDGSVDSGFGTAAGSPIVGPHDIGAAYAVGIQSSGKILVAGVSSGDGYTYSLAARLNQDGTMDPTFRRVSEYRRKPVSMAILPDGRFVLAGMDTYNPSSNETPHWIAHYSADGSGAGESYIPVDGVGPLPYNYGGLGADDIVADPSGNIMTSGIRFNGGAYEMILVKGNTVTAGGPTNGYGSPCKLAMQPNGKLLAVRGSLVRFTPSGVLDPTFPNPAVPVPMYRTGAIACQGNGSVLVGGIVAVGGRNCFGVARFFMDGNPPMDTSASPAEVAENSPAGTLVAALSTADADVGDSFQYSLVPGTGATDNALFAITGNQIHTTAILDFEQGQTRSIRVRVIDSGQNIFDKVIPVAVLDDLTEDIDGDGLTQAQEMLYHSSDSSLDSDGDGLGDYVEVYTYHSGPGSADSDGDGIRDGDELTRGTGIMNPDSDGDGLNDGGEVSRGANPLVADTDSDGFLDGYEVFTGKSPIDNADKPALVAEARTAIEFTFPAAVGKYYRIEVSTDLAAWEIVETGIAGTGGQVQRFYSTRGQPKRYFRVEEIAP